MSSLSRIVDMQSVSFSYRKGRDLISDLSLSVGEGEFIGMLGANGSGKSTILKLAAGILRPSRGQVMLWGKNLQTVRSKDRAKLISYLPQTLDFTVPFTIRQLAEMGVYPYETHPEITVDEALEIVGLIDKHDAHLSDLSGGERRRAFIAMTLVQGAGLVLLDEPLANLDVKYQMDLVRLLRKLRETRKISVVMALHDIPIALQFDTLMVVKEGRLIGSGTPETVLTRDLLMCAFDVAMEVRKFENNGILIQFDKNGGNECL